MRRACSIRSASEKPRSRLMLARIASALKCTALSRGDNDVDNVVLPAPGRPITRILRFMSFRLRIEHFPEKRTRSKLVQELQIDKRHRNEIQGAASLPRKVRVRWTGCLMNLRLRHRHMPRQKVEIAAFVRLPDMFGEHRAVTTLIARRRRRP